MQCGNIAACGHEEGPCHGKVVLQAAYGALCAGELGFVETSSRSKSAIHSCSCKSSMVWRSGLEKISNTVKGLWSAVGLVQSSNEGNLRRSAVG